MDLFTTPVAIQVQPDGEVIFTQNGIPYKVSHPPPGSKMLHDRNVLSRQSYHQSASAEPGQIAMRSSLDVLVSSFLKGLEIRFNP